VLVLPTQYDAFIHTYTRRRQTVKYIGSNSDGDFIASPLIDFYLFVLEDSRRESFASSLRFKDKITQSMNSFSRVMEHASSQDIISRWIYKDFDSNLIAELMADI